MLHPFCLSPLSINISKLQLLQTLKSTQAMGDAMKGVTKAMGQMNRQLNLPGLQRIMMEFERQNERMEMTSEVMGDAIDDALEGDEDQEEETEELVNQVLDEIGIDINQEVCVSFAFVLCFSEISVEVRIIMKAVVMLLVLN